MCHDRFRGLRHDGRARDATADWQGWGATPLRAPAAEGLLRGQKLEEGVLKAAGEKAREAADPSNDVHASADFRRHLVGVLTERALKQAARAAQR